MTTVSGLLSQQRIRLDWKSSQHRSRSSRHAGHWPGHGNVALRIPRLRASSRMMTPRSLVEMGTSCAAIVRRGGEISALVRVLTLALFRDGFHALAVCLRAHRGCACPGAIVTLAPGEDEFRITHKLLRGTRPLHIAVTPDGQIFWGEYFDNPERDEVHIYASTDRGATWDVAYTFPGVRFAMCTTSFMIQWENCLWVLTGDNGQSAASCGLPAISRT